MHGPARTNVDCEDACGHAHCKPVHRARNPEAIHGTRERRRGYDGTDGNASVSLGALAVQLCRICPCDVVIPGDVEEQGRPVEDGRCVHGQYDHKEERILRMTEALSPGEDDQLALT